MRTLKKHDERKQEIIEAGAKLFAQKGYRTATVNDILKEVGIAKGTFYHYFNSKEEVMNAVINDITSVFMKMGQEIASNSDLSAIEKFYLIIVGSSVYNNPDFSPTNDNHLPKQTNHLSETSIQEQTLAYNNIQKQPPLTSADSLRKSEKLHSYLNTLQKKYQLFQNASSIVEEISGPDNAEMKLKTLVEFVHSFSPILTQIVEQGIKEGVFFTPYPREIVDYLLISSSFVLDSTIFSFSQEELLKRGKVFIHMAETLLNVSEGTFAYFLDNYTNHSFNNN